MEEEEQQGRRAEMVWLVLGGQTEEEVGSSGSNSSFRPWDMQRCRDGEADRAEMERLKEEEKEKERRGEEHKALSFGSVQARTEPPNRLWTVWGFGGSVRFGSVRFGSVHAWASLTEMQRWRWSKSLKIWAPCLGDGRPDTGRADIVRGALMNLVLLRNESHAPLPVSKQILLANPFHTECCRAKQNPLILLENHALYYSVLHKSWSCICNRSLAFHSLQTCFTLHITTLSHCAFIVSCRGLLICYL